MRFERQNPRIGFLLVVRVKLMLLAFPHENEAVHFITLVVSEIVAFQPAIGHIQDPTHLVIFR